MGDPIPGLVAVLQQSNNPHPQQRKAAEEALGQNSTQPGFTVLLLQVVANAQIPFDARQAAALYFKNQVERRWKPGDDTPYTPIPEQDRATIKTHLVELMLGQDIRIGKTLSTALQTISKYDFPHAWPNLLAEMVARLNTTDFAIINGVMRTLNYVFKSYRHKVVSDPVLLELKHVLDTFAEPLTRFFGMCCEQIPGNLANPQVLVMLFKLVKTMLAIFHSLNFLDLPEYFEDNMQPWFTHMRNFLVFQTNLPQLLEDSSNEDSPGLLSRVQSSVFRILNLFGSKYEDEFEKFLQQFVTDTWNLLVKTGLEPRHDLLVTSAISFLSTTAKGVHHTLFAAPGILDSICKQIVTPNIKFREADEELFEDPLQYLQRDIEGSDLDTRRRAATDLVTGLRRYYSREVTTILSAHIGELLAHYGQNPQANWRSKDQVIYLVIALATVTKTREGAQTVNELVPIANFFETQIVPELKSGPDVLPVLKADALKFVMIFRRQLEQTYSASLVPVFVELLRSKSGVVVSYAAICLDRYKNPQALMPLLQPAVTNLFAVLNTAENSENPYVMRALLRVISQAGPNILPVAQQILITVCQKLAQIYKNPKNPHFTHYLFEAMASVIGTQIKTENYAEIEKAEDVLMPAFNAIINEDIIDLAPYSFQVMAQLIEARRKNPQALVQRFGELLRKFVAPTWWDRHGNVPALARLVRAYIIFAPEFVATSFLNPVLGVFQKLISMKSLDEHGFLIARDIILHIEPKHWEQMVPEIFRVLFARLQASKTVGFVTNMLTFVSLFMARHGAQVVIDKINTVQPNIFGMLLQSIWVPNVNRVSDPVDRKYCVLGHTKLLFETPLMIAAPYNAFWMPLLSASILVLAGETNESSTPDFEEEALGLEEMGGTSSVFSRLIYSSENFGTAFQEVNEGPVFLHALQNFNRNHPGFLQQAGALDPTAQAALGKLFQQYGFTQPYL